MHCTKAGGAPVHSLWISVIPAAMRCLWPALIWPRSAQQTYVGTTTSPFPSIYYLLGHTAAVSPVLWLFRVLGFAVAEGPVFFADFHEIDEYVFSAHF